MIYKIIFTISLFIGLQYSIQGQISSIRIVTSDSYDIDKNHTVKVKKDIERAVRKTMQAYARYGKLTGSSGRVEQFAIDEFKNLFVSNAQIITDYSGSLKKINASYYASEVFNNAKEKGLDFYFERGVLETLELDADNIYVATVNITKVMKNAIVNGQSKNIHPKPVALTIKLDINPNDLSKALIFDIDGEYKKQALVIPKYNSSINFGLGINPTEIFNSMILIKESTGLVEYITGDLSFDFNVFSNGSLGLSVDLMNGTSSFNTFYKDNVLFNFAGPSDIPLDFIEPFTLTQKISKATQDSYILKTKAVYFGLIYNKVVGSKLIFNISPKIGFHNSTYSVSNESSNNLSFTIENFKTITVDGIEIKLNRNTIMTTGNQSCDLDCIGLGDGKVEVDPDKLNFKGIGLRLEGTIQYYVTNRMFLNLGVLGFTNFNSLESNYKMSEPIGYEKNNDSIPLKMLVDFTESINNSFIGIRVGFGISF